jgi:hypothetical protein
VFAEAAARVVADDIAARLRGTELEQPYQGAGSCYIEFGGGMVGKVEANFLGGPSRRRSWWAPPASSPRRRRYSDRAGESAGSGLDQASLPRFAQSDSALWTQAAMQAGVLVRSPGQSPEAGQARDGRPGPSLDPRPSCEAKRRPPAECRRHRRRAYRAATNRALP